MAYYSSGQKYKLCLNAMKALKLLLLHVPMLPFQLQLFDLKFD